MNLIGTGIEEAKEDAHGEWIFYGVQRSFLCNNFCELSVRIFLCDGFGGLKSRFFCECTIRFLPVS